MTCARHIAVFVVALGLLLSAACKKNKTQLPAKMQAPTLAVSVPDQIPEDTLPPEPPAAQPEATVKEPPPKKAPAKHRGSSSKKPATPPATQPPATNQGNTTVAVNRPPINPATETVVDTAIAADLTSQQLTRQKQTTAELLDSTEKNLKSLNRGVQQLRGCLFL